MSLLYENNIKTQPLPRLRGSKCTTRRDQATNVVGSKPELRRHSPRVHPSDWGVAPSTSPLARLPLMGRGGIEWGGDRDRGRARGDARRASTTARDTGATTARARFGGPHVSGRGPPSPNETGGRRFDGGRTKSRSPCELAEETTVALGSPARERTPREGAPTEGGATTSTNAGAGSAGPESARGEGTTAKEGGETQGEEISGAADSGAADTGAADAGATDSGAGGSGAAGSGAAGSGAAGSGRWGGGASAEDSARRNEVPAGGPRGATPSPCGEEGPVGGDAHGAEATTDAHEGEMSTAPSPTMRPPK